MKKKIYSLTGLAAVALSMALTGCQADMDAPDMAYPVADIKANTTIAELKTIFENKTELVGLKDSVANTHYIIHGRVISSDASGNIYKSLVIQDETAALTFSINQGSMYVDYRLGQEMVVDMTGLYIGYYRGLQQVGSPGDPYNGEPQLGFMAYDYWLQHAQKNGMPSPNTLTTTVDAVWPTDSAYCVITELPFSGLDKIKMQSQLVELRNVHFRQGGTATYAPYHETVSRYLYNDKGDSIAVRNSGYSNFYTDTLPVGKGSVRGILGYYGDSWQLTIRDLSDVRIDDRGTRQKPYTVAEALDANSQGLEGWTVGYIVGSVKAGVSAVSGNDDIIFGPDAELDNNVVIAAAPDVKDWSQCVVVELPQDSKLRRYGNMADNPQVYQKRMEIDGKIGRFLGMPAIVDNEGTPESFSIDGVTVPVPEGDFKQVYSGLEAAATSIDWTFDNVTMAPGLTRVWQWKEYNGSHYLNGNAYVGGAKESLSYAISPVVDLTGKAEARLKFDHAAKFQTVLKTLCGVVVRQAGTTEWKELSIPTWPAAGGWTFVNSGYVDLSNYAGMKVEIAFKYGSTNSEADTWEIRNLVVEAR